MQLLLLLFLKLYQGLLPLCLLVVSSITDFLNIRKRLNAELKILVVTASSMIIIELFQFVRVGTILEFL